MKRLKKLTIRTFLILLALLPVAALAHYILFQQESRCILIDYSGFKKEGRIYFNPNVPQYKIDTLRSVIRQASARVAGFWGQKTCDPKFIYCASDDEFAKYGSAGVAPAATHCKLGAYIVIRNEGIDPDIIAHEIGHAELYERVGFYNRTFKIPVWFNEGLAMQSDYRSYYSEDTLEARSDNYKRLPDIRSMKTAAEFYSGDDAQVMLNFLTARHVVKQWYTKDKLDELIRGLNSGKSFDEAYGK